MKDQVRDIRQARFFWLDNAILDDYAKHINWQGLIVYCALSRFASHLTGEAQPSIPTIASLLGVSEYTVKKGIQNLVKARLIRYEHRKRNPGSKQYASNLYVLLQIEGGGSPHDPGVDRHTIQGGSPHDPGVDRDTTGIKTHYEQDSVNKGTGGVPPAADASASVPPQTLEIISQILGVNLNGNRPKLIALWHQLGSPDATSLRRFAEWWPTNWRAKDGSLPTPGELVACWPSAQRQASATTYDPSEDSQLDLDKLEG